MKDIFDYINCNDNDIFYGFYGDDLRNLIDLLDNYYISMRDKLDLDYNVSFGFELEFDNAFLLPIKRYYKLNKNECIGVLKGDLSLLHGSELSSNVLHDTKETWEKIYKVYKTISKYANINYRCGGHIHVGTHILGNNKESWINFIKLWTAYENVIFRFLYGEFLNNRKDIEHYACPSYEYFLNVFNEYDNLHKALCNLRKDRRQCINFQNINLNFMNNYEIRNTIEFRCPNGSLNPIIWQNNLNFLIKLINYSKSEYYNNDIVECRYLANKKYLNDIRCFNYIYIDSALELCDLIFDNNLDKVNFLRQYFKDFNVNEKRSLVKSRKFTR